MSDSFKHILIVNFDFPPNQGIGGRRWAKFAKELVKRGFVVHVIKADPVPFNVESPWSDDIRDAAIHVHSLPRKYPLAFSHPGSDVLSKIRYRLALFNLNRKEKGSIYDVSIGWEKVFLDKAGEIIRLFGIQNVIASGAPWNLLVYAARLKTAFPDIHFIADFRDPWLNAKNYGMAGLTPERRKAEQDKFRFVVERADAIVAPNEEMIGELKKLASTSSKAQFETLTHFFDPSDIPVLKATDSKENIQVVYGGDLYMGLETQLMQLRGQLDSLQTNQPELYAGLKVKIFTNARIPKALQGCECLEFKPGIGKALFDELNSSNFSLIMLPNAKRNEATTKFMEYLPLRKPMLILAPEGEITDMVRANRLGYVIEPNDPLSLAKIIEAHLKSPENFNSTFDIRPYRLDFVTDKLCAMLK